MRKTNGTRIRILLFSSMLFLGGNLSAEVTMYGSNPEFTNAAQQQSVRKVTGTIKDELGEGMVGVNILLKGTNTGTTSDYDGNFSIEVPPNAVLEISYIGFLSQSVPVGDRTQLDIVLVEDTKMLNEVVVLGYGTNARKQDLSASVGIISNTEKLVTRPVTSTESMLQGQLAGVTITANGGDPTSSPHIVIRGQGSQNGDRVLWVVDGVPGAPVASMSDIESIVVLKDAASAAIYGAQSGAGGVVLVTTKKAKKGKPSISYEGILGIRQATNLPQSLTAEEQIRMRQTSYTQAKLSIPTGWDTAKNPWVGTTRTDWMDEIFRTASYQRHNISLNVGTDDFTNRISFSSNVDNGVLLNTYNNSVGLRYNGTYKLNKWVSISEDFVWKNSSSRGTNTSSAYSGVILSAIYMPRSATVYNPLTGSFGGTTTEDPEYIAKYGSSYPDIHGDVINPVRSLIAETNYNKTSDVWTTTALDITNIVEGLKFTSRFTYNLEKNI